MIRFLRSERALEIHATSPINIALVKYWGKLDEEYIIPLNSSLSITVDQNDLCSRTLVKLVYDQDMNDLSEPKVTLILNGKSEKITHRIMNVINTIRKRAQNVKAYDVEGSAEDNNQQYIDIPKEDLLKMRIEVTSDNNFATASGLASSSSGLSCLSFAIAQLYGVQEQFEGEYSTFARLGSGSACRSIYGGFVQWHAGFESMADMITQEMQDISQKSIAKPIKLSEQSLNFWLDNLELVICCVKPEKNSSLQKDVPSTDGMRISHQTSDLMKLKLEQGLSEIHIEKLTQALENRDLNTAYEIIMKESNQLHAICLDSYPPIFYMNETSKNIIKQCTNLNKQAKNDEQIQSNIVAYSIDAGFHVFLFMLKDHKERVMDAIKADDSVMEGIERFIETRIGREGVKLH
eukprot:403368153